MDGTLRLLYQLIYYVLLNEGLTSVRPSRVPLLISFSVT